MTALQQPAPSRLHHIHLELAREPGAPAGDERFGYDLVLPLGPDDQLDAEAALGLAERCRVRRFRPDGEDAIGRLARVADDRWVFDYRDGDNDDEAGFRFAAERFLIGEYVSIADDAGRMHTFRITRVEPV